MTYGIEVVNPDVNRVILDGNNPVYVIPPIRASAQSVSVYDIRYLPGVFDQPPFGIVNGTGSIWDGYEQLSYAAKLTFTLELQYPLTSKEPPLVFLSQNLTASGPWGINAGLMSGWMPNTVFTPIGVPGRWTGMSFVVKTSGIVDYESGPSKYYNRALAEARQIHGNPPDIASKFILVGHGVQPSASNYGLVIKSPDGKIVFNSDSNIAKAVGAQSRWTYLNRSGSGPSGYNERWQCNSVAPNSNAYVLFTSLQRYRRYNGETSSCAMTDVRGRPRRIILGGRSGSPAHTPILWIEPMKPIERW